MPAELTSLSEIEALEAGASVKRPTSPADPASTRPAAEKPATAPATRKAAAKIQESNPKPAVTKQSVESPAEALSIKLPIFGSYRQCEMVTGIPRKIIKDAKDAGCSAVSASGRVDLQLLLKWIFSQDENAAINWGDELRRFQAQREEIRLNEDRGKVVERPAVVTAVCKAMTAFFAAWDRALQNLPSALKGCDEAEIQKRILGVIQTAKADFKATITNVDNEQPK